MANVQYTTPTCPYCHAAKAARDKGVDYEITVLDPELREAMTQRANGWAPADFVGERHIGGYQYGGSRPRWRPRSCWPWFLSGSRNENRRYPDAFRALIRKPILLLRPLLTEAAAQGVDYALTRSDDDLPGKPGAVGVGGSALRRGIPQLAKVGALAKRLGIHVHIGSTHSARRWALRQSFGAFRADG